PSAVNDAVGAGHMGNVPSGCPFTDRSNAVTCARSATSSVPGATAVGPSVTSRSCSKSSGGCTAPATWAWIRTGHPPAMPASRLHTKKHGPSRVTPSSGGTVRLSLISPFFVWYTWRVSLTPSDRRKVRCQIAFTFCTPHLPPPPTHPPLPPPLPLAKRPA